MNVYKENALKEWVNIFGSQVELPPVEHLNEFIRGQHLPTVLGFMKSKQMPEYASPTSSHNFFAELAEFLRKVEKSAPVKLHEHLCAHDASYGQRMAIAKFLVVLLYEIRMDPTLQESAVKFVVPHLSSMSRKELEIVMDHLDDSSKWQDGEWDRILFEGKEVDENASPMLLPTDPCRTPHRMMRTPKASRAQWKQRTLGERNTLDGSDSIRVSSDLRNSSLLDSPRLRANRTSRMISEKEAELAKLRLQMTEKDYEIDEFRGALEPLQKAEMALRKDNQRLKDEMRTQKVEMEYEMERLLGENDALRREVGQLEVEREERNLVVREKRENNEKLMKFLFEKEDEVVGLHAENEMLNAELVALREELERTTVSMYQCSQELEETMSELQKRDESIRILEDNRESERRAHEIRSEVLEERLRDSESQLRALQEQMAKKNNMEEELRPKGNDLDILDNFRVSIRRHTMDIDQVELLATKTQNAEMKEHLKTRDEQIAQYQAQFEQILPLKKENDVLKDQAIMSCARIRETDSELEAAQEENRILKMALESYRSRERDFESHASESFQPTDSIFSNSRAKTEGGMPSFVENQHNDHENRPSVLQSQQLNLEDEDTVMQSSMVGGVFGEHAFGSETMGSPDFEGFDLDSQVRESISTLSDITRSISIGASESRSGKTTPESTHSTDTKESVSTKKTRRFRSILGSKIERKKANMPKGRLNR